VPRANILTPDSCGRFLERLPRRDWTSVFDSALPGSLTARRRSLRDGGHRQRGSITNTPERTRSPRQISAPGEVIDIAAQVEERGIPGRPGTGSTHLPGGATG